MEARISRKYLAFDLAVAEEVPDGEKMNAHLPLGISCAATLSSDTGLLITWHGGTHDESASGRLTPEEAKIIVQTLVDKVDAGYTLVTWNGLSFDLPIMAEESGLEPECRFLASRHVDMMFHVYCIKGQYLELEAAALGMELPMSTQTITGREAPRLWAQGKHQQVLDHLAGNLQTTIGVALACERRKVLLWTNKRGSSQGMDLPSGWLTVPEAAAIKGIDPTQWRWDR